MRIRLFSVWILNIIDMTITMYALEHFSDYLYEANNVMTNVVNNDLIHFLIKVVFIGIVCLFAYYVYKYYPKKSIKLFFNVMSWVLLIEYTCVVTIISYELISVMNL